MKAFTKKLGGIVMSAVDIDETDGPVCCEVPRCTRMAFERVTMAGYPAGFLCTGCARAWLRLWAEFTTEAEEPVELARAA